MKYAVQHWLENLWYSPQTPPVVLRVLSKLFETITQVRYACYQIGLVKSTTLSVPVIIVGNLSVGGTGKSPLVIYLADLLKKAGYQPGIISRGYGGHAKQWPVRVTPSSLPEQVGDEAVMLALRCNCPIAVGPQRSKAAQWLVNEMACNVILSDDGLQHYALQRSIEIAVIDGERRLGNGYCLPAGPLREPVERLQRVDFVVVNGKPADQHAFTMHIKAEVAVNLKSGEKRPLSRFTSTGVHAIAGIGNPQRFFNLLNAAGITHTQRKFPDHYKYTAVDLQVADELPLLMTEKDAVKCQAFCTLQHWYVPISAELDPRFDQSLLHLLHEKNHGSKFT